MKINLLTLSLIAAVGLSADPLPTPTWKELPKWHGFNLLEKFQQPSGRKRFVEEDFQMIHELGFNFVRLPLDYRCWIKGGNWETFDEEVLKEIDEAIEFGKKYDIHVCINFHRAPGYTVASPAEKRSLWTDSDAQRVCALHWQTFARRYKDVDPKYLSFNLFNEPSSSVDPSVYANVVKMMLDVILPENPNRVVIVDGLAWGTRPVEQLYGAPVAQATRGYNPMGISHYKASWANGDRFPMPTWPIVYANAWFAGDTKKDLKTPLVIDLDVDKPAKFRFKIGQVSQNITLSLKADDEEIWQRSFVSGPGEGEWEKEVFSKDWNIYQNLFNLNVTVDIPAGTKQLVMEAGKGDWCTMNEFGISVDGQPEQVLKLQSNYGSKNSTISFKDNTWHGSEQGRGWLWRTGIDPWKAAKEKGGVMVGEFGCYNKTPHDVALAWLQDCLLNWQEAGFGWAMWNFRGSFGILDSDRQDVEYEDFHGHKLDRKMLDLLLKYK